MRWASWKEFKIAKLLDVGFTLYKMGRYVNESKLELTPVGIAVIPVPPLLHGVG